MIPFNKSPYVESFKGYVAEVFANNQLSGDGEFTKRCSRWLEQLTGAKKVLLTTSGTHALEMAAMLSGFKEDDEVILPSYTFSSTANAFALQGARLVFVDIRPDTMNIDERLIEAAITPKTKAISTVDYAGVACDMDIINTIASKYNLKVIEDAAQGVMSTYKGRAVGNLADFGCFSFHETKNYSMGEGGALILNDDKMIEQAEIMREKGTDRSKFFRGQVDKYSWVELGSSYLPSELNAAYLWSQLEIAEQINNDRLHSWALYTELLSPLCEKGIIEFAGIPEYCEHNAHMFYFKVKDLEKRTALLDALAKKDMKAIFHYVPLHSSKAGLRYGRFHGQDKYTTIESERLVRLPLYYCLAEKDIYSIAEEINRFFEK